MTNLPTRLSEHLSLGRLPLCVLKSQELLVLGAGIQSAVEQLSSQPDTACSFGVYGRQGSKRVSLAELLAPGADEWAGPIEFERLADDHAAPVVSHDRPLSLHSRNGAGGASRSARR